MIPLFRLLDTAEARIMKLLTRGTWTTPVVSFCCRETPVEADSAMVQPSMRVSTAHVKMPMAPLFRTTVLVTTSVELEAMRGVV